MQVDRQQPGTSRLARTSGQITPKSISTKGGKPRFRRCARKAASLPQENLLPIASVTEAVVRQPDRGAEVRKRQSTRLKEKARTRRSGQKAMSLKDNNQQNIRIELNFSSAPDRRSSRGGKGLLWVSIERDFESTVTALGDLPLDRV